MSEDRAEYVEESLKKLKKESNNDVVSASAVSKYCEIPKSSVKKILRHTLGFYPYKIQCNQALSANDRRRRKEFAEFALSGSINLEAVLWTDESYFSLSGSVIRHNSVIWACQKPTTTIAIPYQSQKVCVWFGYSATYRLTPYFFDTTVTGENYSEMLKNHVIPEIKRKRKLKQTSFQQDGAPPHFSLAAKKVISSSFPVNRIISRGFPQIWPPYSPDLSPLDFYFWSTLKE